MKEICLLFAGLFLFLLAVAFSYYRTTIPIGIWQCSQCGAITYVTNLNSHVPAGNAHSDGHIHDWQYIDSLNDSIRLIK